MARHCGCGSEIPPFSCVLMRPSHVHPFPARMASEIAFKKTKALHSGAVVLDPMVGSGTVIRAASLNGCRCVGLDVDPLAILMSKVATSKLSSEKLDRLLEVTLRRAEAIDLRARLPRWFDTETLAFAQYWFAPPQRRALAKLAVALSETTVSGNGSPEANAIRLALSRLIVTKESGASLARDASHSRPHKVAEENDFDVFAELPKALRLIEATVADSGVFGRPCMGYFSAERTAELNAGRDEIDRQYAILRGRFFLRTYKTEKAGEHAKHGFCRRLGTLRSAIDTVYDLLPPEKDEIPSDSEVIKATTAIQAFTFNAFGCLENGAWILASEKGMKKKNGKTLHQNASASGCPSSLSNCQKSSSWFLRSMRLGLTISRASVTGSPIAFPCTFRLTWSPRKILNSTKRSIRRNGKNLRSATLRNTKSSSQSN